MPADPTGGGPRPAHPLRRLLASSEGPREGESATLSYYTLLLASLALLTFGLIMVFSVQSVKSAADGGSAYENFAKYLVFAVVGLALMALAARLPARAWQRLSVPVLVVATLPQLLVDFVPSVRTCTGGNCNWIRLPGDQTVQPSEFIKLAICLYIGYVVACHADRLKDLKGLALWLLVPVGVPIALVLWGGDLGTVIVLVLLGAGALWVYGLRARWFALLGALGVAGFAGASLLVANRRARILMWWFPDSADPLDVGYQPKHGRWALGTGSWTGVGPGASRQKWGYLTQADSDYVFAVLGEEFGLVGTLAVIASFAVVGWCCLRVMRRCESVYVSVVTAGIMTWIVGQAFINMSVVVGLLPVLGVPLPLISAGGSSLISVLAAVGVLLSFARAEPGAAQELAARPGAVRRTLSVVSSRRKSV
ncbi:FtsW/RodA/SpoVE family cell cycle protein [Actinomyces sp. oral taxon 897]|uniref:FtsW/RodA/SpoVE family cell cycle protein n=1 Tax=Actinomyces sp. oral taxon 897 TaxID=2081702 RepID=UPI000D04074D|nr:putative peptidoglycan glycosyltransferase FtsW [Actinomyces sp. oral taxon 897]AVM61040.1 stage V sporulation protein E [Actinomyces sp. oral taxon 897]